MSISRRLQDLINRIAAAQHGVVTRAQLRDTGMPPHSVDRLIACGLLRALHRGVYLTGPLVSPRTRPIAAVLACGREARLSHRSAALVWEVWPRPNDLLPIEVTVSSGRGARRPGIRIHRTRVLPASDGTTLDGVPVTTPERTLLDLATGATLRDLERTLAQALRRGLTSRSQLQHFVAKRPRRPGAARLLALLDGDGPALTRSEAEERFLDLIGRARLPKPEANVRVGAYEVDFFWRAHRLVVEIDGFAHHSSAEMFDGDRRRDAVLTASGLRVMRVTWRQLTKEGEALLVVLAQAISRA